MEKHPLKINYILPFLGKTGGVLVVLEYANYLHQRGHDVVIYYPQIPYWTQIPERQSYIVKIAIFFKSIFFPRKSKVPWFKTDASIKRILRISDIFVRNADITIATAWPTAYDVAKLSPTKGEKYYFVQGHELWRKNNKSAKGSYTLPLNIVTVSPWLSRIMRNEYHRIVTAEVYNAIRSDFLLPNRFPARKKNRHTILMMYNSLRCKGAEEGLRALEMIKYEHKSCRILLFGLENKPKISFEADYYRDPDKHLLLRLYCEADIYLFTSHGEGWGMTPLEAMACRCAVVGTKVGSIEVVYNTRNVIIIEPKDYLSAYKGLKTLLLNPSLCKSIAEEGYKSVQNINWNNSVSALEASFYKTLSTSTSASF